MNKVFKRIIGVLTVATLGLTLAGCGEEKKPDPVKPEVRDYVSELKLEQIYEGKDFDIDGIGEVDLIYAVDGDTITSTAGTIRFLSVDTPESTGKVEPWGKTASKFTAKKLEDADKIVLEAAKVGTAPTTDSSGNRKLAYVWYMPKGSSDFRLLNLELAQEGYSEYQFSNKYNEYFEGAYKQAETLQLGVHSPDGDPNFNTEIQETDLKNILADLAANPKETLGKKVKFTAYVKSFVRNNTYKVAQIIDGKEYEMILYTGFSSGDYCVIGNLVSYVGFVGEYRDDYQITGLITATTNKPGEYTEVIQEGYYLQVGKNYCKDVQIKLHHLFDDMRVEGVKVENNTLTITGKAYRRGREDRNLTVIVPLKNGEVSTIKVGDKIHFIGTTTTDVTGLTKDITINVKSIDSIYK